MADSMKKLSPAERVPNLIRTLEEENPFSLKTKRAFQELGEIGPAAKDAVPTIMESAFLVGHPFAKAGKYISSFWAPKDLVSGARWNSANRNLRREAREALANIGSDAIPELLKGILTGDEEQRFFCADVLVRLNGKIGEEYRRILSYAAPDLVPKLIAGLEKVTQEEANIDIENRDAHADAYIDALAQFGEGGVPYLIDALPADPKKRYFGKALADALAKIGEPAASSVAEVFRNEEGSRMVLAFEAIYQMGPAAKEVALDFARCIDAQSQAPYCQKAGGALNVNLAARDLLVRIGTGAIPYLSPFLNDPNPSVRSVTMQGYGYLISRENNSPLQQDFIFAMIGKLKDPDAQVVAGAVTLLGQYAPGNRIAYFALPLLVSIREDFDRKEGLRNSARDTIKAIEEKVL